MRHGWNILAGVLSACIGAYKVVTGKAILYWDVYIPAWTGWLELPCGLLLLYVGIRAMWRDRKYPRTAAELDAEAARAEAALDALYEREHGTAPDKTGGAGASGKKGKEAGPESPEPATERAGRNADPEGFLPRAVSALTARTALLLLLALAVAVLILFRQ